MSEKTGGRPKQNLEGKLMFKKEGTRGHAKRMALTGSQRGRKHIDPKKAIKAIVAIHKLLYREIGAHGEEFLNGAKEWDVSLFEHVADEVANVIPRPPDAEVCDECGATIPVIADGALENIHHAESCSLHDAENA